MLIDDDYAERLSRLLIEGRLILFAGAGLSLQAVHRTNSGQKMPLWSNLAEKISTKYGICLDDFQGEALDLFDSIARERSRLELEDSVREFLPDEEFDLSETHLAIAKLPWKRVYTTNYDDFLKRALDEKFPITSERDFELLSREGAKQPKLIHLHGTLADMHTLTGEDYQTWQAHHPKATNRFVTDGTENSILFVGYSNSDPHFKYQILPLIKKLKSERGHKNFSWMWQPAEVQKNLLSKRDGIEVHPIDEDAEWAKNIQTIIDAYESLRKSGGKSPKRRIHSRRFERPSESESPLYIHGYKLFYHRHSKKISRERLFRLSRVGADRIGILEKVNLKKPLGEGFKRSSVYEIWNLEKALKPNTSLEYGKGDDDNYAFYIEYYRQNWRKPRDENRNQQQNVFMDTRAVVFDFGGTLTLPKFRESTWERIWKSVGYTLNEAGKLHHEFSVGNITHEQWCDLTCDKLRAKGFSRTQFEKICREVSPIDGLLETFQELRSRNIQIHIVSGSLRDIIGHTLNDAAKYVNSIHSNDFSFDKSGIISHIIGHEFDFGGKARFIEGLIKELKCHPMEILFVGNSLNDEKAATSGARTLCVNPKHTHPYIESMWNNTIREMVDLREILDFVRHDIAK